MAPKSKFRLGATGIASMIIVSVSLVLSGVEWGLALMLVAGIAIILAAGLFRCPRCKSPYLYEGPFFWAHPTAFPSKCRKCGLSTNDELPETADS
jgi:hypothetical protein